MTRTHRTQPFFSLNASSVGEHHAYALGYGYWSYDQVSPGDRRYIYFIDISLIHRYISLMHNHHKSIYYQSINQYIYHRTHQDPVPRSQGGEGQGHPQDPHIMEI